MEVSKPEEYKQYPFYIKASVILIGLIAACYILYLLQAILVPFAFACLIAILINPLSNRLARKIPRGLAILCSLVLTILVVSGLMYFLSRQIAVFSEAIPALKAKSVLIAGQVQHWIAIQLGLPVSKQMQIINDALKDSQAYVGQTVNTLLIGMSVIVLIPIYVFFLLYYKPLILDFIFQAFSEKYSLQVAEILGQTKTAIQSYIIGLIIEMIIVSAMNSTALLVIGVPSAILIGVIGGIINVIPYLGGIVGILLPILMVTVTREGYSAQLAILASYTVIQFIDNNILLPKVVSSKVEINALCSILIVLAGGALWGYSGMFLSIPLVAILKIIFDRIDGLKPWGHLLGTAIPAEHAGVKWQARWERIFRRKKERAAELVIEEKAADVKQEQKGSSQA
jgi:predicted PurR-regulated permease PerM